MTINFHNWQTRNSVVMEHVEHPKAINNKWGKFNCRWVEKQNDDWLIHNYIACVDLNTGNAYLDCSPKKLWAKCAVLTLARPLNTCLKTLYHLAFPISIPIEIGRSIYADVNNKRDPQSAKQISRNALKFAARSLADIVRTPVYGLAMTIMTLAGVLIGPFSSRNLYSIRKIVGNLEKGLNWGKQYSFWNLNLCFQPIFNLMTVHKKSQVYSDTEYETPNPTLRGVTNVIRNHIQFNRRYRNVFNFCQRLPRNQEYTSPNPL